MWCPHSMWNPVAMVLITWNSQEGWEKVDGSPASIEKTLCSLEGQLPETVRVAAGRIGWLLLTVLKHNTDKALQETTQVHELHTKEEALEACLQQLEDKLLCGSSGGGRGTWRRCQVSASLAYRAPEGKT